MSGQKTANRNYIWVGLAAAMTVSLVGLVTSPEAAAAAPVCSQTSGIFTAAEQYQTPVGYQARAASATAWLKGMMRPFVENTGDGSMLTPSRSYGYDETTAVVGSFALASARPTTSTTPLRDIVPSSIDDNYRGTVSGTAVLPGAGSYEVRAYKLTDTEYFQPEAAPAVVSPGGAWSIDLSGVPLSRAGEWRFALHQMPAGTQVGGFGPEPLYYQDLQVELYSVVDAEYLSSTQPALADDTFSFPASYTGTKLIRLRDTSTNTVLAEHYDLPGLIRSYGIASGEPGYGTSFAERTYVYGQALALVTAIAQDDKPWADELVQGLEHMQESGGAQDGGFVFAAPQLGPGAADPVYRTGAHAVALYALLRYQQEYGSTTALETMTTRAFDYLDTLQSTSGGDSGLYLGGSGRYVAGVPDGSYVIPWASTEHNVDIWHALFLADRVFPGAGYGEKADQLQQTIRSKLWNVDQARFNQGYQDTAEALDVHSWGAMFLLGVGDYDKVEVALGNTDDYLVTVGGVTGYTPYLATGGYPGATETAWYEGTFGVGLARLYNDDAASHKQVIDNTLASQEADGSWRYANAADSLYEIGTSRSVASTAWYVLSAVSADQSIWRECVYVAGAYTSGASGGTLAPTGSNGGIYVIVANLMVALGSGTLLLRRRIIS